MRQAHCAQCKKKVPTGESFCSRQHRNKYYREYYHKNREKWLAYQKKYQSERSAKLNRPKRARALKAWETRRNNGETIANPWTRKEEDTLIKNYKTKTYKEISKMIKRTDVSIQKKARKLGIKKK